MFGVGRNGSPCWIYSSFFPYAVRTAVRLLMLLRRLHTDYNILTKSCLILWTVDRCRNVDAKMRETRWKNKNKYVIEFWESFSRIFPFSSFPFCSFFWAQEIYGRSRAPHMLFFDQSKYSIIKIIKYVQSVDTCVSFVTICEVTHKNSARLQLKLSTRPKHIQKHYTAVVKNRNSIDDVDDDYEHALVWNWYQLIDENVGVRLTAFDRLINEFVWISQLDEMWTIWIALQHLFGMKSIRAPHTKPFSLRCVSFAVLSKSFCLHRVSQSMVPRNLCDGKINHENMKWNGYDEIMMRNPYYLPTGLCISIERCVCIFIIRIIAQYNDVGQWPHIFTKCLAHVEGVRLIRRRWRV